MSQTKTPYRELRPSFDAYRFKDVHVVGARIQVDMDHLSRVCAERAQMSGAKARLEPVSNVVMLEVLRHPLLPGGDIWSASEEFRDLVLVRALVREIPDGQRRRAASADDVRMICLLALTNDPWFLVDGRELVGYPMLRGVVRVTAAGPSSTHILSVSTDGFSEVSSLLTEQTIIEFHLKNRSVVPVSGRDPCFPWRKAELGVAGLDVRILKTWNPRQSRDALVTTDACFASAMLGEFVQVDPKERQWMKDSGHLIIRDCRSLRLTDLLGLRQSGEVRHELLSESCYTSLVNIDVRRDASSGRLPATGASSQPYVELAGDPQGPPPYRFENVDIFGFKLPVRNPEKLRRYCESVLNFEGDDQGFKYKVATDFVVVELLEYGSMRFDRSGKRAAWQRESDRVAQNELVIRVLVGKVEDDSGAATEPKVFVPVIFVDNAWSVVCGREVIGFPKLLAKFEKSESGDAKHGGAEAKPLDGLMTVKSVSMRRPPGQENAAVSAYTKVISVSYPNSAVRLQSEVGTSPRALEAGGGPFNWVQGDFEMPEFTRSFVREWFEMGATRFRNIQVKQIKDWKNPSEALFAQLIESESVIDRLSVGFPEGVAEITFGDDYVVETPAGRFRLFDALGITSIDRRRLDPQNAQFVGQERRDPTKTPPHRVRDSGEVANRSTLRLATGDWYVSNCDFSMRMIDPLRDHSGA